MPRLQLIYPKNLFRSILILFIYTTNILWLTFSRTWLAKRHNKNNSKSIQRQYMVSVNSKGNTIAWKPMSAIISIDALNWARKMPQNVCSKTRINSRIFRWCATHARNCRLIVLGLRPNCLKNNKLNEFMQIYNRLMRGIICTLNWYRATSIECRSHTTAPWPYSHVKRCTWNSIATKIEKGVWKLWLAKNPVGILEMENIHVDFVSLQNSKKKKKNKNLDFNSRTHLPDSKFANILANSTLLRNSCATIRAKFSFFKIFSFCTAFLVCWSVNVLHISYIVCIFLR